MTRSQRKRYYGGPQSVGLQIFAEEHQEEPHEWCLGAWRNLTPDGYEYLHIRSETDDNGSIAAGWAAELPDAAYRSYGEQVAVGIGRWSSWERFVMCSGVPVLSLHASVDAPSRLKW